MGKIVIVEKFLLWMKSNFLKYVIPFPVYNTVKSEGFFALRSILNKKHEQKEEILKTKVIPETNIWG